MKNMYPRRGFFSRLTWGLLLVGLFFFSAPSYAEDPVVDSADPSSTEQGTYDLEVTVVGENFGADSEVDFFVTNTENPGGIKVKNVKRKNPKTLKVTIDVDPDAQTDLDFDIEVRSGGRTGKGTELFRVLKVPKLEEVVWQVEIPDEDMAEDDCIHYVFEGQESDDCNLYGPGNIEGTREWVTFANSETVEVDVFTNQDPETKRYYTVFSLKITEPGSIGFRDLRFAGCRSYCLNGGEGQCTCQVFPGSGATDCCEVWCCEPGDLYCGAEGYSVMKNFMEGSLHPTAGYDNFSLRFSVPADIDSLDENNGVLIDNASLWWWNLWNTDEVMVDGDEFDHNVVAAYWIPLEDVVVERVGDEWTVTVNQCGWPGVDGCPGSDIEGQTTRPIVFWESYYQGIWIPTGKSGKYSLDSEYRRAVGSGTPFKFITKWKRITNQ